MKGSKLNRNKRTPAAQASRLAYKARAAANKARKIAKHEKRLTKKELRIKGVLIDG